MPLRFTKRLISHERFESAAAFDVDNDGVLDIVSGGYWYQGPDFTRKHHIWDPPLNGEYYEDFSTIPIDVNGDGYLDIITGGWSRCILWWLENPGSKGGDWPVHVVAEGIGNIETTRAWDVDRDGQVEIVPNTPNDGLTFYKLVGPGRFEGHRIYQGRQGHGLGFGDITGKGRGDFVLSRGWLEAPEDPYQGEWVFHPDLDLGSASVPILVVDVNRDGVNDLIVGHAHGYGLDWWEADGGGRASWRKHPIDPYNAQYHDIQWADLDGDGEPELIAGKRYRAHNGDDPGEWDDQGVYYFKWNGESFSKQVIDYGPIGVGGGCGIQFALADLRGTGRLDVIAPGKDGLHVFYNEGP